MIDQAEAARAGHAGNGHSARVLVLEGTDYASCLLREAGADRGLVVISPRDPRGALDRLPDDGWDAAVLHLPLPRTPGDDLLSRLETLGPDRKRRVVFLAGEITRPETRRLLTRVGRPYLTPPVEPAELLDLVLRVANGSGEEG